MQYLRKWLDRCYRWDEFEADPKFIKHRADLYAEFNSRLSSERKAERSSTTQSTLKDLATATAIRDFNANTKPHSFFATLIVPRSNEELTDLAQRLTIDNPPILGFHDFVILRTLFAAANFQPQGTSSYAETLSRDARSLQTICASLALTIDQASRHGKGNWQQNSSVSAMLHRAEAKLQEFAALSGKLLLQAEVSFRAQHVRQQNLLTSRHLQGAWTSLQNDAGRNATDAGHFTHALERVLQSLRAIRFPNVQAAIVISQHTVALTRKTIRGGTRFPKYCTVVFVRSSIGNEVQPNSLLQVNSPNNFRQRALRSMGDCKQGIREFHVRHDLFGDFPIVRIQLEMSRSIDTIISISWYHATREKELFDHLWSLIGKLSFRKCVELRILADNAWYEATIKSSETVRGRKSSYDQIVGEFLSTSGRDQTLSTFKSARSCAVAAALRHETAPLEFIQLSCDGFTIATADTSGNSAEELSATVRCKTISNLGEVSSRLAGVIAATSMFNVGPQFYSEILSLIVRSLRSEKNNK